MPQLPELSQEEFIKILEGKRPEFLQSSIGLSYTPNGEKIIVINSYQIRFVNTFEKPVQSNYSIYLYNCSFPFEFFFSIKFQKVISFKNCQFYEFAVIRGSEINIAIFEDVKISRPLEIENCEINALKIEENKFEGTTLKNCTIDSFSYKNVGVETLLSLEGGNYNNVLIKHFNQEIQNRFLSLNGVEITTLFIHNFKGKESNVINNCKIRFFECIDLKLEKLSVQNSIFSSVTFQGSSISEVNLFDNYIHNFISNINFKNLNIKNSRTFKHSIENLQIIYSSFHDKSSASIINQKESNIILNGIKSKDNSLILKDLELNNLEINDFSNEGTLRLHNVQFNKDSIVKIDNSFLGKTELNNVDFSLAKEFYISKSNVLDLITTNTKYPKNRDTYKGENEEDRRELFRQLKTISSKNKEQEQIFEGFELDIQESLTKKWNDKIALFLNRISNSHGQNWILALIFTLLSSLIFFILYVISLQNTFDFRLIFNSKGYQFLNTPILDYFKYYFEFLNPTHRFNFITDDINFASSFWDFLGRTFTGYGIYQLIAAFRKHGKKA